LIWWPIVNQHVRMSILLHICENCHYRTIQTRADSHACLPLSHKPIQLPPREASSIGSRSSEVQCSCFGHDSATIRSRTPAALLSIFFIWHQLSQHCLSPDRSPLCAKPASLVSTTLSFRADKTATVRALAALNRTASVEKELDGNASPSWFLFQSSENGVIVRGETLRKLIAAQSSGRDRRREKWWNCTANFD
jgi:hypothetical protein